MATRMEHATNYKQKRWLAEMRVTQVILQTPKAVAGKPFMASDAVEWGRQHKIGESTIKHQLQEMLDANQLSAKPSTTNQNALIYTVNTRYLVRQKLVKSDNGIPLGRYYP